MCLNISIFLYSSHSSHLGHSYRAIGIILFYLVLVSFRWIFQSFIDCKIHPSAFHYFVKWRHVSWCVDTYNIWIVECQLEYFVKCRVKCHYRASCIRTRDSSFYPPTRTIEIRIFIMDSVCQYQVFSFDNRMIIEDVFVHILWTILSSAKSGPGTAHYFHANVRATSQHTFERSDIRGSNIRLKVIGRYPDQ